MNLFSDIFGCRHQLLTIVYAGLHLAFRNNNQRCENPFVKERLCVTLRYLVTGDAQLTIAANYRISPTVVGRIISETCGAIWDALHDEGYMKPQNSEDEWKQIAKDFEMKWNFPNALGAIDGKHVVIQAPAISGSSFFNYNKQHSIVLMAVCTALYRFFS